MREELLDRVRELGRRAGVSAVPRGVVMAALAVVGIAIALLVWRAGSRGASAGFEVVEPASGVAAESTGTARSEPGSDATASALVYVHVVGAVRHPGLYELAEGARVEAAIEAAGGLLGNAAPAGVNLARKVTDGEQIAVPTGDEAARGGGGQVGVAAPGSSPGAAVDINAATADELDALPGIGPATALKIVADRQANGPFASVEDLGRISGIGPKKLDALKDLICVR